MIAKIERGPEFDLEDWLTSVLIDCCDVYGDPAELLAQLRAERVADALDEVEALARTIVRTGVERGWLSIVELTFPADTHPAGDPFREPEDARTLAYQESLRAIDAGSMWIETGRGEASVLALECTIAGSTHLDSLNTCYE